MNRDGAKREVLLGMSEICAFLGLSEKKVLGLARKDPSFPVRKDGIWMSNRRALDEWSYRMAKGEKP